MARLMAKIVIASLAAFAAADSFLAKTELSREEVKQALLSELLGRSDDARLRGIEDDLRPMYTALPKGEEGLLELATVRYALHRFFLKKYGWFVKGLESAGDAWNATGATTVLKARASSYILELFEEHLHGKGMGLHELAVFAATLADLVHAEAIGQLSQIHSMKGLSKTGPISRDEADSAIADFLVMYLLGGSRIVGSDIPAMKAQLKEQYPYYPETDLWMKDLRQTYDLAQAHRRNPFVQVPSSFDESSAFVVEFSHKFGSFQNLECHALKRRLTDMEFMGTGRVRLAEFYSNALSGGWEFMESIEYLRNQGALDETDPESPTVVIPNYLNSRMNCLTASDYYASCCLNECDAILDKLEATVAAPHVAPAVIAETISMLPSESVDAPRNLSAALLSRLDEIAQTHDGTVPLHGRLFAQWLHHAYPRECNFPHVSGTYKPMYPVEFARAMGEHLLEATPEVMKMHAARAAEAGDDVKPMVLPWSADEELVARHKHFAKARGLPSALFAGLKTISAVLALASFSVPLVRAFRVAASPSDSKPMAHLV